MQLVSIKDIGGSVVKDSDVYLVKDNKILNDLVLSSTFLRANKHTTGHRHEGQEEVYQFVHGHGKMQINETLFDVGPTDVVLIEDGVFHKVYNDSEVDDLVFICVFDGKRNHP